MIYPTGVFMATVSYYSVPPSLSPRVTTAKVITHWLYKNPQPSQIETTCSNRLNIFKIPLNLFNKLKNATLTAG